MNTLSLLSCYVYLLGNDARILYLYTEGENFMSIHELLQDLYEVCFEYYDTFAEMAIAHGETIPNPSDIVLSEGIDWNPTLGDAFSTNFIIGEVKEKGNKVITMGDNLDGYEGFVKSEIDAFNAELDSIVNYKFGRIGK